MHRDKKRDVFFKLQQIRLGFIFRQFTQQPCPKLEVGGGNAVDQVHKGFTGGLIHKSGHAEVHRTDPVFFHDKDISRVGICMEKPILKHLFHDKISPPTCDQLCVKACGLDGIEVICLDPLDIFHGQDPLAGFGKIYPGNMDGAVRFELVGHLFHIRGFNGIIQFFFKGFGKFFHNFDGFEQCHFFNSIFHDRGQVKNDFKVCFNGFPDTGPLDFHGYLLVGIDFCPVNLADGCAGKRGHLH